MQAENVMQNENLEVEIQNMNIGQHQNPPDQGGNQQGGVNDVLIDIGENEEDILDLNVNIQKVQPGNHRQAPVGIPQNQKLFGVDNNQIIPAAEAGAGNQQIYPPGNQGGQRFPLARLQVNLRHGNAMQPPVAMGARNLQVFDQNQHRQLVPLQIQQGNARFQGRNQVPFVFNQRQMLNQQVDGMPMNLANHHRAPNAHEDEQAIRNNVQGRVRQVNDNAGNIQAGGNVQMRGTRDMHGSQQGHLIGIDGNLQHAHHQQANNQVNALQIPAEPHAVRNVNNRQSAVNNHHSNRQNNRYAPYMDMRRMTQNAKTMAMMVWSMAEAAMYVPNRYTNNQPRSNPDERDEDDRSHAP